MWSFCASRASYVFLSLICPLPPQHIVWSLWSVFSMPFMHLLSLLCNVASVGSSLIGVCAQFCFQDGEVFFVDGREGAPQWPTAAWAAHVAFWSVDMVHGEHCANAVGAAPFGNAVGAAVVGVARAPGRARARGFRRGRGDGLRSRCGVQVCVCVWSWVYRFIGGWGRGGYRFVLCSCMCDAKNV